MEQTEPKPSFEDGLKQLDEIVRKLEGDDLSLEDSIKLFESGVSLSQRCRKQLEQAETRVEGLMKDGGGKPEPRPFERGAEDPF